MEYQSNPILLTIAIPTYNREKYLDLCLSQICKQIDPFKDIIELIVSDNCSTDNTEQVVKNYIDDGYKIFYIKNIENIGPDRNFEQCFNLAKGKYLWLFGDDEVLLDKRLKDIIFILTKYNVGNVFVSPYAYYNDYLKELPDNALDDIKYEIFTNTNTYIRKVNFWLSFVTGNIINKSLFPENFNSHEFMATSLIQVNWNLNSLCNAKENIYINSLVIAGKADNSGGYKFFEVFGKNFRTIFIKNIEQKNINLKALTILENWLISQFFPSKVLSFKLTGSNSFWEKEEVKSILYEQFRHNIIYWLHLHPLLILPYRIGRIYSGVMSRIILLFIK